jgi:hypothetical protein
MSSTVLIADASIPFSVSLAGALRGKDASIAILSSTVQEGSTLDLAWNRPSPLSARTVALDAKNRFGTLDCAVLSFDPASIPLDCKTGDSAAITHLFDEYVRGNALMASEIASLFRKQKKGLFCFVLVNRERAVLSPAAVPQEKPQPEGLSPDIFCAMAESAFVKMAEEISSACAASPDGGIQCALAKVEPEDETAALDWLVAQIDNPASRKENRWVKPGAKGLFAKFS